MTDFVTIVTLWVTITCELIAGGGGCFRPGTDKMGQLKSLIMVSKVFVQE